MKSAVMITSPGKKIAMDPYVQAVQVEGRDVLVTANAGSGKTHLLVDRYFHLLSSGVSPWGVAAFTFTEKAARELKERILSNLPKHPNFSSLPKDILRDMRDQIHQAPIGTIHQFCLRILQESPQEGTPFRLKIIDEASETNLRETLLNQILQEELRQRSAEIEVLLPIYGMPGLRDALRSFIIKEETSLPLGKELEIPPLEEQEKILLDAFFHLVHTMKEAQVEEKKRKHWLSFNDLETKALKNLQDPTQSLGRFLSSLTHLLLDEFQDTSPIQIAILDSLRDFKKNKDQKVFLYAVGDPKQSIYRFRNVDRRLIDKTEQAVLERGGIPFILNKNYRSVPKIVALTNVFSQKAFPKSAPSQSTRKSQGKNQFFLQKLPVPEEGNVRKILLQKEARWVAQQILEAKGEGYDWEDMAVLFRASASALPLLDHLKQLSIPFTLRGGRDLFSRQEVQDLKNLLYFLDSPREDLYLVGVLRSPVILLSDAALFFLRHDIPKKKSLYDYLCEGKFSKTLEKKIPEEVPKLRWARNLLIHWVRQASILSPYALLRSIAQRCNLVGLYGEIGGDWEGPLSIEQFLNWVAKVECEMEQPPLREIVQLLKQLGKTPILKPPLGDLIEETGCVQLLTIHAAKGLQFPKVFLLDLARPFPPNREIVQYYEGHWALKIPSGPGEFEESPRFQAIKALHRLEESEENKRLLYVALTRAQDQLTIPLSPHLRGKNNLQSLLLENLPGEPVKAEEIPQEELGSKEMEVKEHANPLPVTKGIFQDVPLKRGTPWITVSQLETYFQCPLKFHFSYREGFSDEEWTDPHHLSQTQMGTLLHRGLNYLNHFPNKEPGEVIRFLLQTEPLWNQEGLLAQLSDYLENYLSSPAFKKISQATEDFSELPFLLKLKNGYLRGQLDRLVKYREVWHLIDFKFTDKKIKQEEILKVYGFQLKTYALAAQRFLQGISPKVEVHLLGNPQTVPLNFSDSDLKEHEGVLAKTIQALARCGYEKIKVHEHCFSCPFHRKVPICPVPRGESISNLQIVPNFVA